MLSIIIIIIIQKIYSNLPISKHLETVTTTVFKVETSSRLYTEEGGHQPCSVASGARAVTGHKLSVIYLTA